MRLEVRTGKGSSWASDLVSEEERSWKPEWDETYWHQEEDRDTWRGWELEGAGTSWCLEPGKGGAVTSTGNHSIL